MKKNFMATDEIVSFGMDLQALDRMIKKFDRWYRRLPEDRQKGLENMYGSFFRNLSDAKSDMTALFSGVLVYAAADYSRKDGEDEA